MATTYSATVWPPLEVPAPESTTGNGGTADAPTAPPQALPEPTETRAIDHDPTPPPAVSTTYVRPAVTQATTDAVFKIVNGSNVVTNPYPLA